ncbi:MAG: hypothetical protein V1846_05365 [Candidatus Komeilibacteria bacterium]
MIILGRLMINAIIIAGLFSFVPGVGTASFISLAVVAVTLSLINSLMPWLLPLAGISFNLGSFVLALIVADGLLVWLGVTILGIIFVISYSAVVLVVVVMAILSWFVQSLGFNYYHK